VDIEEGKTLIIKFQAVGDPHADGRRSVFFELNGQPRAVLVEDRSLEAVARAHPKAAADDPKQVGGPMPGLGVKLAGAGGGGGGGGGEEVAGRGGEEGERRGRRPGGGAGGGGVGGGGGGGGGGDLVGGDRMRGGWRKTGPFFPPPPHSPLGSCMSGQACDN